MDWLMKAYLPFLILIVTSASFAHAEVAADTNQAKNLLRSLHQQLMESSDTAKRSAIATSIMEQTLPLTKAEPDGVGGWLLHGQAALELKDLHACTLAAANLTRLKADTSGNPLAGPIMTALRATISTASPSATKEAPFINSLGMKFVPVPNTTVLVCIHETRKRDYLAYYKASGSTDDTWLTKKYGSALINPSDDHPVAYISWTDAVAFCSWLSDVEKRKYRLLTDHEWSCAVGIGDEDPSIEPMKLAGKRPGVFPWGGGFPPPNQTANLADSTFAASGKNLAAIPNYHDGFVLSAPVMSFPPNELGIYDLAGNVVEWTMSLARLGKPEKAVRGSTWYFESETSVQSDYRRAELPDKLGFSRGFRIAVEQEAKAVPVVAITPPPSPAVPATAKTDATLLVKNRLQPQPNGDLMLVDTPTLNGDEGLDGIDLEELVWMKQYYGWTVDIPQLLKRDKLDTDTDFDVYAFITGSFAKEARVRVKGSRSFDKNDAVRALKKGDPTVVWRYFRDAREGILRGYAEQRQTKPDVKLPDPRDPDEKSNWPKYDKALEDKGERVMMASIIYGYNEARGEFIICDPQLGPEYQKLWITAEELKATVYEVFVFE
jgi:hypothetical protein